MTTIIKAHYDGKAFIPDEPVDIPVNEPLTLKVESSPQTAPSGTAADLLNSGLVGIWKDRQDIGDSLEFARKLRKEGETRRHQINDPS